MTPFRYPGAKTRVIGKIVPTLRRLMRGRKTYLEPFVGGGSIVLSLALDRRIERIVLNDADPDIAAFWWQLVDDPEALIAKVREARPSVELHRELQGQKGGTTLEAGFRALFLNRCSFSGILSGGPIGGAEQRSRWSVDCRWNPKALEESILLAAGVLRGRTTVYNADAVEIIPSFGDAVIYADPPYFEKGQECYRHWMQLDDHRRLAQVLQRRSAPWLLSYDAAEPIRELYGSCEVRELQSRYSISGDGREGWAEKVEFLIHPEGQPYVAGQRSLFEKVNDAES